MGWQALKFQASPEEAANLSELLLSEGALSVAIENADELDALFQYELAEDVVLWQVNTVSGIFDSTVNVSAVAARVGIRDFRIENIEEQDWVRSSQSQFAPIQISPRLWIAPSWHEDVDRDATTIVLDPGLAFGTGSHPSTRLCLTWLAENIKGGESVLDYGCGSGILAIAAAKLGAAQVIGVDIDPVAVSVAQENAEKNKISAGFFTVDNLPAVTAKVVVANILAQPLKMLAPLLAEKTAFAGTVVLSGILRRQAEGIAQIYGSWFHMQPPIFIDEWACFIGTKKTSR